MPETTVPRLGGRAIIAQVQIDDEPSQPLLSLLFAAGERPSATTLSALADAARGRGVPFAVTHFPSEAEGWLELLAMGLTFDCRGLAPADGEAVQPAAHFYGIEPSVATEALEAVVLAPGPHLVGGNALLPVVRIAAGVAAALAELPGLRAVCWHAAASWMDPAYFARMVDAWLDGGAFPALGLTSIKRESDGALVTNGLAFLIGKELHFTPAPTINSSDAARIVIRLVHELVERGGIDTPLSIVGPDGTNILVRPSADRSVIHAAMVG